MLGETPNKVYDHFLKARLGYQNPERLKKAIAAQPKMYHGEMLYNTKLKFDSPNSEETLEDAEESRLKMRNKMKNELLKDELVKSSSDSKDIQANLLKRIKILENDFKRSQAQSIDFELKLQHQKEKMDCDVSWKSKLSTLNDENNQDLLITISELKNKLKIVDKGKNTLRDSVLISSSWSVYMALSLSQKRRIVSSERPPEGVLIHLCRSVFITLISRSRFVQPTWCAYLPGKL
ncbi:hypothetical protein Tco_1238099 [Tanacetum coccineum]